MCVEVAGGCTGEFKVSSSKSDVGTYGQNDTVGDSPRVSRLRETIRHTRQHVTRSER